MRRSLPLVATAFASLFAVACVEGGEPPADVRNAESALTGSSITWTTYANHADKVLDIAVCDNSVYELYRNAVTVASATGTSGNPLFSQWRTLSAPLQQISCALDPPGFGSFDASALIYKSATGAGWMETIGTALRTPQASLDPIFQGSHIGNDLLVGVREIKMASSLRYSNQVWTVDDNRWGHQHYFQGSEYAPAKALSWLGWAKHTAAIDDYVVAVGNDNTFSLSRDGGVTFDAMPMNADSTAVAQTVVDLEAVTVVGDGHVYLYALTADATGAQRIRRGSFKP